MFYGRWSNIVTPSCCWRFRADSINTYKALRSPYHPIGHTSGKRTLVDTQYQFSFGKIKQIWRQTHLGFCLALTSFAVSQHELFQHSELAFYLLETKDNTRYLVELPQGLSEKIYAKWLEKYLAHSRFKSIWAPFCSTLFNAVSKRLPNTTINKMVPACSVLEFSKWKCGLCFRLFSGQTFWETKYRDITLNVHLIYAICDALLYLI